MERPVFIIGVPRSGTTLLRYMINSGPTVYIPGESGFIPRFFGRDPHGALTRSRVDRMVADLHRDYPLFLKRWNGPDLTGEWLWQAMPDKTPRDFIDTLYSQFALRHSRVRWGDKTPIYTNHMRLIDEILPDSLFVHLVRDARDVALSTDEKWGDRSHVDIYYSSLNWAQRTRNVEAAARALGTERVYTLRYEDLIARPRRQLRAICEFIGMEYVPSMAKPHLLGRKELRRNAFSAKVRTQVDASNQAKWKRLMPPRDIRLVQSVAGDVLQRYDYEIADLGEMSKAERARLAALAAKFAALRNGRRIMQSAGFKHPN